MRSRVAAVLLILMMAAGCYHTRVVMGSAPATPYAKRTVHQLFWGLYQQNVTPPATDDCVAGGFQEVRVTTTFLYSAVTVLSLGIWSPITIEWRCAKRPPQVSSR